MATRTSKYNSDRLIKMFEKSATEDHIRFFFIATILRKRGYRSYVHVMMNQLLTGEL